MENHVATTVDEAPEPQQVIRTQGVSRRRVLAGGLAGGLALAFGKLLPPLRFGSSIPVAEALNACHSHGGCAWCDCYTFISLGCKCANCAGQPPCDPCCGQTCYPDAWAKYRIEYRTEEIDGCDCEELCLIRTCVQCGGCNCG